MIPFKSQRTRPRRAARSRIIPAAGTSEHDFLRVPGRRQFVTVANVKWESSANGAKGGTFVLYRGDLLYLFDKIIRERSAFGS